MKKKITIRTVLVTALLVLLIAGVAIAATSKITLRDIMTLVPQTAQDVLEQSGEKTYILGGVKFTMQESIADGELIHITTKVESLDEDVILYPMMPSAHYHDMTIPLAYHLNLAEHGVEIDATILEMAQQMQKKIYGVAVDMEFVDENGCVVESNYFDERILDTYQQEDTMVLANLLIYGSNKEEIQIGYKYCFTEYDPLTGEKMEETALEETDILTIPVQPVLGVRTFRTSDESISNDVAYVRSVKLTHKATGVYVDTYLMVKNGVDVRKEFIWDAIKEDNSLFSRMIDDYVLLDDKGNEYDGGMRLSSTFGANNYPILHRNSMIVLDSMPDHVTIGIRSEDGNTIAATYTLTDYTDEK